MSISIYNTKTKKKEKFKPVHSGEVRMYVCGPTVYGFLHVGNFRGAIFFNVVRNWFEKSGYKVNYIYNYTDVDDKIIQKAKDEKSSPQQIAEKYIFEFEKDYKTLGLKKHSSNPKATEYISQMIKFIEELIEKKMAYIHRGSVYYDVCAFKKYGNLSNKNLEDLESGYRIDVSEGKKNPFDFALWKSVSEKGESYSWDSPWGRGRPGWHIECSVMSLSLLGDTLDIHGGGVDLVFPHHENEVAQSEARTGKTFVNYWMHNNMIQFGDKKMSKSLGNITTGREFLEKHGPEVLKFMMLNAHYRSPISFSKETILSTTQSLAKFYSALDLARQLISRQADLVPVPKDFQRAFDKSRKGFEGALNDDFNTAEALAYLFELTRSFNHQARKPCFEPQHKAIAEIFISFFKDCGQILSLFCEEPSIFLKALDDRLLQTKNLKRSDVDKLVAERTKARAERDFKKSDVLRDRLVDMGISLRDTTEGTFWEVAK